MAALQDGREWRPIPINELTLFDITGEPPVEGQEPPECQICTLPLYNPALFPVEIRTCHHRFHRDCLRNHWCVAAGNTLQHCRCPICRRIFNCNIHLQDLTPLVNHRLQQFQPIPENYARQNYLIDVAKKRFTDCVTLILNESRLTGAELERVAGQRGDQAPDEMARLARSEYIEAQIKYINVIIDNFKNNQPFATLLSNSIPHLNTINNRLQNQEFIELLKGRDGNLGNYANPATMSYTQRENYLIYTLNQCYTGITGNNMAPINHPNEAPGGIITWPNHIDDLLIKNMVSEFLHHKYTPRIPEILRYLDNILPISAREGFPSIDINHIYFQRYFQCFLDFLTSLVRGLHNEAGGIIGGKQKTRKQKSKRVRKSKRRNLKK